MKNILVITASAFGQDGQSTRLVNQMVRKLQERAPDAQVVRRDLAAEPVPHLDGERVGAFFSDPSARNQQQQAILSYSDQLIAEVREADAIILGVPMYNFGVPSVLKAYFDHIARAGVTFRYTENGPQGLLADKPVYVMAARGGIYKGTEADTQTPYIRTFLGFLGLTSVEFVYAEGLNLGEEHKSSALAAAEQTIEQVAV
ncbi:MAG: NAD(P)H-dependent oxidoreductase [Marinobacter sp.]|nr:NAD(P)H-dependent oxidoreductase [Marinobacter sp.]